MLKKTIKYTDYNGEEHEEDFYFNMNKFELTEMELSEKGGLAEHLSEIAKEEDGKSMIKFIKDFILKAYGVRSEDGRRFIKNEELSREFEQTEAFSELFMELATNEDAVTEFIKGIIPSSLGEELEKQLEASKSGN